MSAARNFYNRVLLPTAMTLTAMISWASGPQGKTPVNDNVSKGPAYSVDAKTPGATLMVRTNAKGVATAYEYVTVEKYDSNTAKYRNYEVTGLTLAEVKQEIKTGVKTVRATAPKIVQQAPKTEIQASTNPQPEQTKTEQPPVDTKEAQVSTPENTNGQGSTASALAALKKQSGDETTPPATGEVKSPATGEAQPPAADEVKPPATGEAQPPATGDGQLPNFNNRTAGTGTIFTLNSALGQNSGGQTPSTTGQTFDPNFRNNHIRDWRVGGSFWQRKDDFNLSGNIPSFYLYGKEGKATFFYERLGPNQWVDVNRQFWMSYEMGTSQQPWTLTAGRFEQGKKDDKNTPGRGWGLNIASGERELLDGAKVGAGNGNGGYTTMAVGSPVRYDGSSRGLTWNFDTIQTYRFDNGYTGSTNFTMRANTENGLSVFSYNQLQIGKSTYFNLDGGINERGAGIQLNLDHRLQHGFGIGLNYENWGRNWNGGANALGAEAYWKGQWSINNSAKAYLGISYDTALWGNNAIMNRNGGRSGFILQGGFQFRF